MHRGCCSYIFLFMLDGNYTTQTANKAENNVMSQNLPATKFNYFEQYLWTFCLKYFPALEIRFWFREIFYGVKFSRNFSPNFIGTSLNVCQKFSDLVRNFFVKDNLSGITLWEMQLCRFFMLTLTLWMHFSVNIFC